MNLETLSFKFIIKELDFPKKTVIVQWNIRKKRLLQLFATKVTEKILDSNNAKEYYNSYLKWKNTEQVEQ